LAPFTFVQALYVSTHDCIPDKAPVAIAWLEYLLPGIAVEGNCQSACKFASRLTCRAESVKGLPSATIIVNAYDPLRDEGEAYAQRLREAGIDVWTSRLDGLVHASIHMRGLMPQVQQLYDAARLGVRRALAEPSMSLPHTMVSTSGPE
jgi:acetyl esterase/lipase